jgi:hypothetical protein
MVPSWRLLHNILLVIEQLCQTTEDVGVSDEIGGVETTRTGN